MEPVEKKEEHRILKPYHGVIALVISALTIFVIGPFLSRYFGAPVSILAELLLLVGAVCIPIAAGVDLRKVFPLDVPTLEGTIGTLLLYGAVQPAVILISLLLNRLFPQALREVSQGMSQLVFGFPVWMVLVIITVLPSICEEAVFRGVLLHSVKGRIRNKWIIIIATGIIFGAFHGNVLRAIPTSILGMVLGYLMIETGNLFYSVMFHFINNFMAVVPILLLQALYNYTGGGSIMQAYETMGVTQIPLLTIGIYIIYAAVIPFGAYAGNYLLHIGKPGYQAPLFAKEHRRTHIILGIVTVAIILFGIFTMIFSLAVEQDLIRSMVRIAG